MDRSDKYWRYPKKARTLSAGEAWWYAEPTNIQVYGRDAKTGVAVTVILTRRQLAAYLARSAK